MASLYNKRVEFSNFRQVLNNNLMYIRRYATEKSVSITFRQNDGLDRVVKGHEGQDLMRLAHENNIDLEGACEGSLACSTCHVILDKKFYDRTPEPSDEENDMLDLAFGLTET